MDAARLLVVDDEEMNREIIGEYLDDDAYQLTMAQDGEQALALLNGGNLFDVVILDRMMPSFDGMEVLRRMKVDQRLRSVPVIMQTAAASHEQVAEGLALGAYYYLTKPYHRDALVAVVQSALESVYNRAQLLRQRDHYRGVIGLLHQGTFRYRTLGEARALAAALAGQAQDEDSVGLGLVELMINAVEHGNLGISFHDKAGLLAASRWEEEVEQRLAHAEHAHKYAEVEILVEGGSLRVAIRDQGSGFDWNSYLNLDEKRALYPNGRGIALANTIAFRSLEYVGSGNEVRVVAAARDE